MQDRSYADYRKEMSEKGAEYEDFAFDLLSQIGINVTRYVSKSWQCSVGECSGGIEIKFDDKSKSTGNLYIETQEKGDPSRAHFSLSGIYREDNSWLYVIGDYNELYIFAKTALRLLDERKVSRYEDKETGTSRGFLLPKEDARKYAAKVLVRGVDFS